MTRLSSYYIGKPVESLQTMLRLISEQDPQVLPLIPDGYYGGNTFASVRSFQQAYGISPTGIADQSTWDAITAVYNRLFLSQTPPSTHPIWPVGTTVLPGDFNYHIYLIQAMLAALSHFFPELGRPQFTGILDTSTSNGLKWVQRASSIPITGVLNTETWHYLNGIYQIMTNDGTATHIVHG